VITWRCNPTPPHEPEDKPTPPSKFYEITERWTVFQLTGPDHRWILLRERLPLGRKPMRKYEACLQ
jgi:hypothetical protein